MPTYITLYRFTGEGIKTVKESPARIEKAKKAVAKAGGKVKAVYATMGQYDIVAIAEWPNAEAAATFLLGQGAMGNVSSETMRAFTEAEFKKIVSKIP